MLLGVQGHGPDTPNVSFATGFRHVSFQESRCHFTPGNLSGHTISMKPTLPLASGIPVASLNVVALR
jgi:hypothetical protein